MANSIVVTTLVVLGMALGTVFPAVVAGMSSNEAADVWAGIQMRCSLGVSSRAGKRRLKTLARGRLAAVASWTDPCRVSTTVLQSEM